MGRKNFDFFMNEFGNFFGGNLFRGNRFVVSKYLTEEDVLRKVESLKKDGISFNVEAETQVSVCYCEDGVETTLIYTKNSDSEIPESHITNSAKIAEIDRKIAAAVAKEDYALAAQLKKEKDTLI